LHHLVLERWSRGASAIHRLDPRAKIVPLLVFLATLATSQRALPQVAALLFVLLCMVLLAARIPILAAMARATIALPFAAVFAGACWISGDPARGAALTVKSYLSALAVVTAVASTPLPSLLRGLEMLGAPLILLTVAQFLYRYLFVISEEAQHMRKAASARGGGSGFAGPGSRGARFHAAAGALAVLFARSYGQARDIHNAMLARGFTGRLSTLSEPCFGRRDAAFAALASVAAVAARLAAERIA
jgi:cobalt/nickel transport system permease protein